MVLGGCRSFLLLVTTTEIRRHVECYFRDQCRHDFPPRAVLFFPQIQDTILWLKKPFKTIEFS